MSVDTNPRYIDVDATTRLPLGPCSCADEPHPEGDFAVVRTEVGWGELKSAFGAGQSFHEDGTPWYDEALGDATAIRKFTRSWTLVELNAKGKPEPRPISVGAVLALPEHQYDALKTHVDALFKGKGRLPNPPGGPSQGSSRRTARRSLTTARP